MDNIHQLHSDPATRARLLEQWVTELINEHPDAEVAERWAELARNTLHKYASPPEPSKRELDLSILSSMPEPDREAVILEVQAFIAAYFEDVRDLLVEVNRDLLSLQKQVAELEHRQQ